MKKIVKLIKLFRSLFPSKLPVGMEEFEAWAQDFEQTFSLPTKDKDTVRFVLTTAIMHLGPQVAHKSKVYFYLTLRAGAAKQVAGAVFHDIKLRQQEAARKAQEEATKEKVASNGQA